MLGDHSKAGPRCDIPRKDNKRDGKKNQTVGIYFASHGCPIEKLDEMTKDDLLAKGEAASE